MRSIVRRLAWMAFAPLVVAGTVRADGYFQTNLISDKSGMGAQVVDGDLINPWGISFSGGSPFWVSNQGAGLAGSTQHGTSTLYSVPGASGGLTASKVSLTVTIPNDGSPPAPPSNSNGPTGQVSTSQPGVTTVSTDFQVNGSKAAFIFANLDGSISAWNGGGSSTIMVHGSGTSGPSYTGLAIANATINGNTGAFIYAADQNSPRVDIYNSSWVKVGSLTDPNLPSGKGFTAFNVQNINGVLYVTFAIPGVANGGIVDAFSPNGATMTRVVTDTNGTHLQTPWGLTIAPASFGPLANDLLVGNNRGDGTVNAYASDGTWKGQLMLANGTAFSQADLWGLTFGNGGGAGSKDILYFAAGLPRGHDGLFGALSVPEPGSAVLGLIALGTLAAGWGWKHRRRGAAIS